MSCPSLLPKKRIKIKQNKRKIKSKKIDKKKRKSE